MPRRLPPLLALRAFEAVGRHLSFSRAADELCVTHGAISRQIRTIEAYFGQPLFLRKTRRIEFTPIGQRYFNDVSAFISDIERSTCAMTAGHDRHLTVDAMPSTASAWLMPNLSFFTESTEIEVNVVSSIEPVDFRTSHADAAIRLGQIPGQSYAGTAKIPHRMVVDWSGVTADHLCDEILVPVCSCKFMDTHPELNAAESLDPKWLIHVVSRPQAWSDWSRAHLPLLRADAGGSEVGHQFVALQMARRHRGIALVPTLHLDALEWRDELVQPWAGTLQSAGGFCLLFRATDADKPKIVAFRRWLKAAAQHSAGSRTSGDRSASASRRKIRA